MIIRRANLTVIVAHCAGMANLNQELVREPGVRVVDLISQEHARNKLIHVTRCNMLQNTPLVVDQLSADCWGLLFVQQPAVGWSTLGGLLGLLLKELKEI